uniref:hypothetical protein n=1 Tax=Rhodoblastus sp. TaxID=1962975 RepID=UPI003F98329D
RVESIRRRTCHSKLCARNVDFRLRSRSISATLSVEALLAEFSAAQKKQAGMAPTPAGKRWGRRRPVAAAGKPEVIQTGNTIAERQRVVL